MDVGIVIALREEFREFLALLPVKPTVERDETGQYSYVFVHPSTGHRCVVTFMGEMNPGSAAIQTERLLARWSPRVVVMLGIAAGIHSDVRVGDVVIASQVDNYLDSARAQEGSTSESFEFSFGGTVYQGDHDFLTQIRNFEFAYLEYFARWRQTCAQDLVALIPDEAKRSALVRERLVREEPDLPDAHLASGPVVAAAQQFTQWLRANRDRNLKALDMESAGVVAAAMKRKEPARTLVIRGISDYGDERKSHLDAVGEGALRRYAMRNATQLLWELLAARLLPAPSSSVKTSKPNEDAPAREVSPFLGISVESLGAGFKGRERDLVQIHALLQETNTVTLTGGSNGAVYANGGGGMGKSRLAVEYAYRYRHEYPGGVFFANVSEREPRAVLAEFARALFRDRAPSQEDDAAVAFVEWLKKAEKGPRLLIFDDVQAESRKALANRFSDPVQVKGQSIWPLQVAHVSLLLTTRMRDLERELKDAKSFSVERLNDEAAKDLLLEKARPRVFPPEEHVAAKALAADDLGGHPLAISLAGAYLGRVKTISLAGYLETIHEVGLTDRLEKAAHEVGYTIRDHEHSIAATYEVSLKQLDSSRPVDRLALSLLRLAALLAAGTPVDPKLLERLLKVSGESVDSEQIGLALARLTTDLSLLDEAGRSVSIHLLISDYTRWRMEARERNDLQRLVLLGLRSLFPYSMDDAWKIMRQGAHPDWEYLSAAREAHVFAAWNASSGVESEDRIILSWCLGDLYLLRGKSNRARGAYEEAIEIATRLAKREPGDPRWDRCLSVSIARFGRMLSAEGDLKGTRRAYEQSLEICEKLADRGPDNDQWQRDLSVSLGGLGNLLIAQGDLEGARHAHERSLKISKRLAEQKPGIAQRKRDVLVCFIHMGDVLERQEKLEEARMAYERALEIATLLTKREPTNSMWQRDVSVVQGRMGNVLRTQGDLGGARRAYEQALNLAQQVADGEPSNTVWQRDVLLGFSKLAEVLRMQNDLDGARRSYVQALELARQLAGRDRDNAEWQSDLVASLVQLATFLKDQDRVEARKLLVEARDLLREMVANDRLTDVRQHQWLPDIEFRITWLDGAEPENNV